MPRRKPNPFAPGALGELLDAAGDGDLAQVKKIAAGGVDVDAGDRFGFTALNNAAHGGHLEVVRYLVLEKSANPRGGSMLTPLHSAVSEGKYDVAVFLLEQGATMDDRAGNDEPLTPLDYARRHRFRPAFIDLFISRMDDARKMKEFFTAAEPEKAVPRADSEKSLAGLRESYINIIAGFTRDKGFDLNVKKDGSTALHLLAAWQGGAKFVKVLADAGADISLRDGKGRTAEEIAVAAGSAETAQYLAELRSSRSVAAFEKGAGANVEAPAKAKFSKKPGL